MEAPEVVRSAAVHVWTTEAGVAGTLIDPFHVVVPQQGILFDGSYPVSLEVDVAGQARFAFDLPQFGLAAMVLDRPAVPFELNSPVDGECASFWAGAPRRGRIENGSAYFDWPPRQLQFDPIGAPLVVDGSLGGVLGPYDEQLRGWRVLPAIEVADAVAHRFYARFSPSARRALMHAFGSSNKQEVHNEHLLLGLYENPDSSTRRLFDARNMTEETLRQLMMKVCSAAQLSEYAVEPLQVVPPLSRHARESMSFAMNIAAELREPEIRSRHLLHGILSSRCDVPAVLASYGIGATAVQLKDTFRNAGYVSDAPAGRDHLNVGREAAALANVLGSSLVEPPVAVGLLGNWGSGKSFFMKTLEAKLKDVEQRGGRDSCSNIIQIWFNAWHYIDANLWASLTCEIFDKLDDELRKRDPEFQKRDPATERAEYLAESAKAQSERDAAAARKEKADQELAEIAEAKESLQDPEKVAARVGLLTMASGVAKDSPQVQALAVAARNEAREFANAHHLDAKTIEELRGTAGTIKAVYLAAKKNGPYAWRLLVGLAILTPVAAVAAVILRDQLSGWVSSIGVIGMLATAGRFAKQYLPHARKAVGKVSELFAAKDKLIAEERTRAMSELETRGVRAEEARAQAAKEEQEAATRLRDAEQKLLALRPAHQMKSFVRERRESTDYTQHLGVVAKAHDDFDRLSRYLENLTDEKGERVVDRIVLYIDDLDRCPESKVFDVLQAVHLLLAFKLFVVVVGVDSRWLLHSLKTQMKQFAAGEDEGMDAVDRTLWESTPLNYLEKIFQIPFTLRPMPESGYGDLIEDLTRSFEEKETARVLKPILSPAGGDAQAFRDLSNTPIAHLLRAHQFPIPQPEKEPDPIPPLTLTRDEIDYMKQLYTLMPSPRGVKRFVNLYRIIRGLLDEYRREAYLAGEYEAALLLLAMLTGFPEETTDVLQELASRPIASSWWDFITGFVNGRSAGSSHARWSQLGAKLESIRTEAKKPGESRTCEHFAKWAPEIARFSFHSGRIASDYRGSVVVAQQAAKTPMVQPSANLV